MPGSSLSLETRDYNPNSNETGTDRAPALGSFFEMYSKVRAFTKPLKKPNEAVDLFSSSKLELEQFLKSVSKQRDPSRKTRQFIATCHALLSLIHWLYPNYRAYDRLKNALTMYDHAKKASDYSESNFSETFIIGMFVQLRVLPFLLRSNRPLSENLSLVREKALSVLSSIDSHTETSSVLEEPANRKLVQKQVEISGYKGLLHDALGFSYWSLERDSEAALEHLEASTEFLVQAIKESSNNVAVRFGSSNRMRKKPFSRQSVIGAKRSFYQAVASVAYWDLGLCNEGFADRLEGDEMMRLIKMARADYERSYNLAKKTTWNNYKGLSAYMIASTYEMESERETEREKIRKLLKKAINIGDEALRLLSFWSTYDSDFLGGSWIASYYGKLADFSEPRLKRTYMLHSLKLAKRAEDLIFKHESKMSGKSLFSMTQIGDIFFRNSAYYRQLATNQKLALNITTSSNKKRDSLVIEPLKKSLEYAIRTNSYYKDERFSKKAVDACLLAADVCYELIGCNISEEEKREYSALGKKVCKEAQLISKRNGWNEAVAESNWFLAEILDIEGKYRDSATRYLEAHNGYERAKKISEHASRVYQDFANYMLAWRNIELAKISHMSSDFEEASVLYFKAAHLISLTRNWSKGSQLFLAESLIERAESKSLMEEGAEESIELFDQAISYLSNFREEVKREDISYLKDFEALSNQLSTFCRARRILEKSKEDYRLGEFEESISGLANAEAMFEDLASNSTITDPLRSNEMRSMSSLCRALSSFQKAQVNQDPELYLEARNIFGKASEESKSKTLRPLLSGLASFASFLFYSDQVEKSLGTKLDVDLVDECNTALGNAQSNFRKVGNRSFLNILKASKHILDATIKMSSAEREVERIQVKAKLYAQAQSSLSKASRYYKLVGSSKRLKEALKMISAVRNHQRLIPLAHDIIAEVASNQIIYAAIASSSVMEQTPHSSSVGLGSSYVSLDAEVDKTYMEVDQTAKITLSISNLGRESITTIRIDDVVPEGFEILDCQVGVLTSNTIKLNMRLEAGATKDFTVTYTPKNPGECSWHPSLIFLDSSRNFKISRSRMVRSIVEAKNAEDFASLLRSKSELELRLESLKARNQELDKLVESDQASASEDRDRISEEIYGVKEKISQIEEKFLRTRNEYDTLMIELERVRSDIQITKQRDSSSVVGDFDTANLKDEEKLLLARIERRRQLLEQAQLL